MDLGGAVWHGKANCLTHFCEQVCDASAVTVIDQTSDVRVGMLLFQIDTATRVCDARTVRFSGLSALGTRSFDEFPRTFLLTSLKDFTRIIGIPKFTYQVYVIYR